MFRPKVFNFAHLSIFERCQGRNRGIFLDLKVYFIQHRPSDSTVSEDAGIKSRTVATSALAVRLSNHSTARSIG